MNKHSVKSSFPARRRADLKRPGSRLAKRGEMFPASGSVLGGSRRVGGARGLQRDAPSGPCGRLQEHLGGHRSPQKGSKNRSVAALHIVAHWIGAELQFIDLLFCLCV